MIEDALCPGWLVWLSHGGRLVEVFVDGVLESIRPGSTDWESIASWEVGIVFLGREIGRGVPVGKHSAK